MPYAKGTSVSVEKSRAEIESIITKHGATTFSYAIRADKAMIQFEARDREIRFILPLPSLGDCSERRTESGRTRQVPFNQRATLLEQICRERWRALKIAILAKLESIESGIEAFDEAFFSHIVDPVTRRTLYEVIQPQIKIAYEQHDHPIGLPSPEEFKEGEIVK